MALLPIQMIAQPAFVAPTASPGDEFENDGTPFLMIVAPGARTLTVKNPHPGQSDYQKTYAAGSIITPRFDPIWWNDPKTGRVAFEFDDETGVLVAAVRGGVIGVDPNAPPVPGLF